MPTSAQADWLATEVKKLKEKGVANPCPYAEVSKFLPHWSEDAVEEEPVEAEFPGDDPLARFARYMYKQQDAQVFAECILPMCNTFCFCSICARSRKRRNVVCRCCLGSADSSEWPWLTPLMAFGSFMQRWHILMFAARLQVRWRCSVFDFGICNIPCLVSSRRPRWAPPPSRTNLRRDRAQVLGREGVSR